MLIGSDTTAWYIGIALGASWWWWPRSSSSRSSSSLTGSTGRRRPPWGGRASSARRPTGSSGVAKINDSGVRILHAARAIRKAAVGALMTVVVAPGHVSQRNLWYVTLAMGLVVALVVAAMLLMLIGLLRRIQTAVNGLLEGAGRSPRTRRTSPSSRRPRRSSSRSPPRESCRTAT